MPVEAINELRQEVSDLRASVKAMENRFEHAERRIEQVDADGKRRTDGVELEMRRRDDKIDEKFGKLGSELTSVGHGLAAIRAEQTNLRRDLSDVAMEGQSAGRMLVEIKTKMDSLITSKAVAEERSFQWRQVVVPAVIAAVCGTIYMVGGAMLQPLFAKLFH